MLSRASKQVKSCKCSCDSLASQSIKKEEGSFEWGDSKISVASPTKIPSQGKLPSWCLEPSHVDSFQLPNLCVLEDLQIGSFVRMENCDLVSLD